MIDHKPEAGAAAILELKAELASLHSKLAIVTKMLNEDREDLGVAMFQSEMKAAIEAAKEAAMKEGK